MAQKVVLSAFVLGRVWAQDAAFVVPQRADTISSFSPGSFVAPPVVQRQAESPSSRSFAWAPALTAGLLATLATRSRQSRRARGGEQVQRMTLEACDEWIGKLNLDAFGKEVHELGRRLKAEQGEEDQKHLRKMIFWSRLCAAVGLGTMWLGPNPLSVIALSLWTHSAWTMIGHHVCHGGYNRTAPSGRYSSRGFAIGSLGRRIVDWFDWMLPEAWSVEHNNLHHYRLGEDSDPDLLERNAETWKGNEKYTMPFVSMLLWKWAYYAPNTYKEMKVAELRRQGKPLPDGFDPQAPLTLSNLAAGKGKGIFSVWEFVRRVIGPYFLARFFLLPLPLALVNPAFFASAVVNLALADVLSNIHGFIVIVTNHAGSDLYRFQVGCKPKSPTFYLRAVTSSANFDTGSDLNDFMHGWLNYQIEHHCWPDLSMRAYQKGQPELRAICEKYGVPYVQENVFVRLKKTMDIAMGLTNMRRYPRELESEKDIMVWSEERARVAAA
uniref:Fatty acid desaturase domain-containing protein n=1 Tax=Alexandrium monilatum TaxID=311494 RepID=A0A7S4S721_9DINO